MTLQISKLREDIWQDCNDGACREYSIYEIENMNHGAVIYSCKSHLCDAIDFEMSLNGE